MESKVIFVFCKFNSFISYQFVLFFYYTIIILIIDLCFDILHTEMKLDESEEVILTMEINRNKSNDDPIPKSLGAISINIHDS
jgi:hypothetical protein